MERLNTCGHESDDWFVVWRMLKNVGIRIIVFKLDDDITNKEIMTNCLLLVKLPVPDISISKAR